MLFAIRRLANLAKNDEHKQPFTSNLDGTVSGALHGGHRTICRSKMASTACQYPGEALDSSKREIRILGLLPGLFNDDTACTLGTCSINDSPEGRTPPPYEALSYSWGQLTLGETIRLNHEDRFPVTDNLAAALRRLRHPRDVRMLWVDALCVDQSDLAERSEQVSYMRLIFGSAERTVVWLGELGAATTEREPAAISRELPFNVEQLLTTPARPYWWTRAWVVQEFALSRADPLLLAGPYSFAPSDLLSDLYELSLEPHQSDGYMADYDVYVALSRIGSLSTLGTLLARFKTLPFTLLIQNTRQVDATLAKDRIYALLGLMHREEADLIKPDYARLDHQVFAEAVSAIARADKGSNILILKQFTENSARLPSWMVDIEGRSAIDASLAGSADYFQANDQRLERLRSGTLRPIDTISFSRNMELMKCTGVFIHEVTAIHSLPLDRSENAARMGKLAYESVQEFLTQLQAHYPYQPLIERCYPHESVSPIRFSNLLSRTHHHKHMAQFQSDRLWAHCDWILKLVVKWTDIACKDACNSDQSLAWEHGMSLLTVDRFLTYADYRCNGHGCPAIVTVGRSFLGLVSHGVQPGDHVILLDKYREPVILRECEDGLFTFQGMAFVPGIMEGELDALPELPWQQFVIK